MKGRGALKRHDTRSGGKGKEEGINKKANRPNGPARRLTTKIPSLGKGWGKQFTNHVSPSSKSKLVRTTELLWVGKKKKRKMD